MNNPREKFTPTTPKNGDQISILLTDDLSLGVAVLTCDELESYTGSLGRAGVYQIPNIDVGSVINDLPHIVVGIIRYGDNQGWHDINGDRIQSQGIQNGLTVIMNDALLKAIRHRQLLNAEPGGHA